MPSEVKLWRHPDNGRYYVIWTEKRRSFRVSTRTTDSEEAERFRKAFELERNDGEPKKATEVEVGLLLDSYYERHAEALPSAERIGIAIRHLKNFFGSGAVSTVNARNLERYIQLCRDEGKADGTINRHLGSLRAGMRFAVKSGDLRAAPFVPSLKEPPPRPHVLSQAELDKLLKAARANADYRHIETFILIASHTGARRSAILQLTWDRVDLKAGTIDFRRPGVAQTRKRRAITGIAAGLVRYLAALKKRTDGDDVIQFRGKPVASIKRAFRNVAEAAGLPHVTPHVLKHTFVSHALQVTSPWVVSGMTATSLRTLQAVYGKHMVADQKRAAEAMAALARKTRANKRTSAKAKKKAGPRKRPAK